MDAGLHNNRPHINNAGAQDLLCETSRQEDTRLRDEHLEEAALLKTTTKEHHLTERIGSVCPRLKQFEKLINPDIGSVPDYKYPPTARPVQRKANHIYKQPRRRVDIVTRWTRHTE
jgi:hypothetical protein